MAVHHVSGPCNGLPYLYITELSSAYSKTA